MSVKMMPDNFGQVEFASLMAKFTPEEIILLRTTRKHSLYRLACRPSRYILKWCHAPKQCREPSVYALLKLLGVATLPVYAQTDRALVLEDLQSSPVWRLADQSDMAQIETGEALAEWYRNLHQAGRQALQNSAWPRYAIHPWVDEITKLSLEKTGTAFMLEDKAAWKAAVEYALVLKTKYLALPQTFNYNDFAAENLALSRDQRQPLRAIVFDYDCFTTGAAYSDWRNVIFSLQGPARNAFEEGYGPIDEAERLLDEPLAILYGLVIASQRDRTPSWAGPLAETVFNGELGGMIRAAVT